MNKLDELISELCPDGVEFRNLGDVLKICNGKDYKKFNVGNVPVYGSGGIMTYIDTPIYDQESVLIPRKGSLEKLYYVDVPFWAVDTIFYTKINLEIVIPKFVYYCLQKEHLEDLNQAGGVPSLTKSVLDEVKIPIPPIKIQAKIVRILDTFTDLISDLNAELILRRKQFQYYRDQLLTFGSDVEFVNLGSIGKVSMCKRIMKNETSQSGEIPFYKIGTFGKTVIFDGKPSYFQDSNILDKFDKLCNDLTSGIPAEINARKKQYQYYRDKLLTFTQK